MTKKELHSMCFNDAASQLQADSDLVTTYENLLSFAKHCIDEECLFLAIHILTTVYENPADFYGYNYCMGTLDMPTPLLVSSDLEDYTED